MGKTITFQSIGLTPEHLRIDAEMVNSNYVEYSADFTDEGERIFNAAAARYGIDPEDFFDYLMRSTFGLPDSSQDP